MHSAETISTLIKKTGLEPKNVSISTWSLSPKVDFEAFLGSIHFNQPSEVECSGVNWANSIAHQFDKTITYYPPDDLNEVGANLECFDGNFLLKCLSAISVMAAAALFIAGLVTLNPVLIGIGAGLGVVGGFALYKLGFFSDNPSAPTPIHTSTPTSTP